MSHLGQRLDQLVVVSLCQLGLRGQREDGLKGFLANAPLALSLMCVRGRKSQSDASTIGAQDEMEYSNTAHKV